MLDLLESKPQTTAFYSVPKKEAWHLDRPTQVRATACSAPVLGDTEGRQL